MDTRPAGVISVPAGAGASLVVTGGTVTRILSGRDADAAYSLYDCVTESQRGPRPHRHHDQDEDFYVLEGEVEFRSGAQTITVRPGGFVRVPRGTVHSFTVTSAHPCRMLIVLTPPGGVEGFWAEIGIPAGDASPPTPPGATDFARIAEIARKHGMEFVPSGA